MEKYVKGAVRNISRV